MNPFHRRRDILALGASAIAPSIVLIPRTSFAQTPAKVWRVGFVWGTSQAAGQRFVDTLLRKLRELGSIEGRDFSAEYRWTDGSAQLAKDHVAALVQAKVDLLVTWGTNAAQAVKAATRDIPAVFAQVSDPVASGIVASLARPGGNISGVTNMLPDISEKLLELLKGMAPKMSRIAVLGDPDNPGKMIEVQKLRGACERLRYAFEFVELRTAADVAAVPAKLARFKSNALVILADGVTWTHQATLIAMAAKLKQPAIYQVREFVAAGGLISYGLNVTKMIERAAEYIHRIFKGTKPADLPVEQPTRFELVINRKTANQLGLKISGEMMLRADEVIE